MAAMLGFAIVFGISLTQTNPLSTSLIRGLIGALAFVIIHRWWMRKVFTELHHALYDKQRAEALEQEKQALAAAAAAAGTATPPPA